MTKTSQSRPGSTNTRRRRKTKRYKTTAYAKCRRTALNANETNADRKPSENYSFKGQNKKREKYSFKGQNKDRLWPWKNQFFRGRLLILLNPYARVTLN